MTMKMKTKEALSGYAYISPWIIGFFGFYNGTPNSSSLYLGFTKYNLLTSAKFVGFSNYSHLFKDHDFWQSLYVTLYYAIFSVPLDLMIALILAIYLIKK